jgi:zinc protease
MGATIQSPDRFALEVLMTLLTGQSGRLFLELRDRRSLAYDVSGLSFEGIEPGSLAFYLAVDPSRLSEAHAALLTELDRIVREPPEAEELERARRFLIGNQAISLQRNGARAAVLALNTLYGLGAKEHVEYPERIKAVSRDDVLRVARKYLLLRSPTLVVIGPGALPETSADPGATMLQSAQD